MKYVIEHMEEGFSEWVILEYSQIIKDVGKENLVLTSLPAGTTEKDIPQRLRDLGLQWTIEECVHLDGGVDTSRVCLLDDRTGVLREKYGFAGRRLGALQMTTDTAIRTTQRIVKDGKKFEEINFIDYPEIRYNKYESTEMPFRYILDSEGTPILPEGMLKLIEHDAEQSIDDLLVE